MKCGNWRCEKEAALGQKYCSAPCSPYGYLNRSTTHGSAAASTALEGEINGKTLAQKLGTNGTKISQFFYEGCIPGRRVGQVVWYRDEEVRKALLTHGRRFREDGTLIPLPNLGNRMRGPERRGRKKTAYLEGSAKP
jgi:hypothetical protein